MILVCVYIYIYTYTPHRSTPSTPKRLSVSPTRRSRLPGHHPPPRLHPRSTPSTPKRPTASPSPPRRSRYDTAPQQAFTLYIMYIHIHVCIYVCMYADLSLSFSLFLSLCLSVSLYITLPQTSGAYQARTVQVPQVHYILYISPVSCTHQSYIVHISPYIVHISPYIVHISPYIVHISPCTHIACVMYTQVHTVRLVCT